MVIADVKSGLDRLFLTVRVLLRLVPVRMHELKTRTENT